MNACLRLMLLMAVGLLSTGCAYESRWNAAGKQPTPANEITGRWEGTWKSDANGHSGGLRCIVTKSSQTEYLADFKATYGWIFTFGYQMKMQVKASDSTTKASVVYFTGEEDLGWLAGGKYTYEGRAGPTEFFCNYKSGGDRGTFQLVRPGGTPVRDEPAEVVRR